jgi:type I restriction enzyme S subunit
MSTAVLDESTVESAALRDALLPRLIRGEIRMKDAERVWKERGL